MKVTFIQSITYRTLMQRHIEAMLNALLQEGQEFAVACEREAITFDPQLPSHIVDNFTDTVLFIITNYTFESAVCQEGVFVFEAGFGEENFGSTVSIPFLAIKQIFIDETPIVLNYAPSLPPKSPKNSMEALLNNPENRKLLKKKSKS